MVISREGNAANSFKDLAGQSLMLEDLGEVILRDKEWGDGQLRMGVCEAVGAPIKEGDGGSVGFGEAFNFLTRLV